MIGFIRIFSFILIVFGLGSILSLSIKDIMKELTIVFQGKEPLKNRILLQQGKKKKNKALTLIEDSKNILRLNGKEEEFPKICMLSLAFSFIGMLLGIVLSNYFIVPVLGVGMCIVPFVYIIFLGVRLKKQQNEELETALSVITSSYVRSENIVIAIKENKEYINQPVKEVFDQFILQVDLVNPDIKTLLHDMKSKIDNTVFHEWCDAIIACQDDGALKSTLLPIVKKLSNIRTVSVRLDAMLYAPVKEYITMVVLLVANVPLMYLINRTWFEILIYETVGKLILAICAAIIFISSINVIRITRPIEYKR